MINKKYLNRESLIIALDHLIEVYEKSIFAAITNPSAGANMNNMVTKLAETKKVKEKVIEMPEITQLDDNHTYNIVTRPKEGKVYHTITVERIENENKIVEKEYILDIESK